jgi:transitional endoplasmic reticulum ATPase
VQKTGWDDVILDDKMKKTLTGTVLRFFDSATKYREFGVPWKRGLIFHGPPGNGKTISLKALMHSLFQREDQRRVVPLYVKSMEYYWELRQVFQMARQQAPCLLILEDIDTLVTEKLRSYFFNELDGLENNNGIMIIATTNHLDKLDPGLSKRPSRFDRKYNFPLPSNEERTMYCEFWRQKLKGNKNIVFPKELSPRIAGIMPDFSFAYMKEAFVATLLAIARREEDELDDEFEEVRERARNLEDDDIEDLVLWKEMKKQVQILREDMDSTP